MLGAEKGIFIKLETDASLKSIPVCLEQKKVHILN